MKKFLVLYRMDMAAMSDMMKTMSKEDHAKGMAEWGEWMKQHAASFADPGAPAGKNTRVTAQGSSQAGNDNGGYSIVQAESMEEATKMLAGSPHLKMPGATCDVMEIVSM